MKRNLSAGIRLVLSGALAAASVIGVSWCFAELSVTPLAEVGVAMLMLPPMLVLAITFAREVIRLAPESRENAPWLARSAPEAPRPVLREPLTSGAAVT